MSDESVAGLPRDRDRRGAAVTARDRFMARYADPTAAREVAEIAFGMCLRHVSDPSSVDLTDDEQERLYELLLTMLATDDA